MRDRRELVDRQNRTTAPELVGRAELWIAVPAGYVLHAAIRTL